MRKCMIAVLVAFVAVAGIAKPGEACPHCPTGVNCVGWPGPGPYSNCIQYDEFCVLIGGGCPDEFALVVPQLTPDGSVDAALVSDFLTVTLKNEGNGAVNYTVAGCQSYVVSRSYAAGEAQARRERASLILI